MRIGIICPSEIAFRRFMPALQQCKVLEYGGIAYASSEEWFGNKVTTVTEALKKEVKAYKKIRKEMPVLMKVSCIVDDEPGLTKGKIYDVLTEENGLYGVGDDEDIDVYLHGKSCFEVVESE